MEDAAELRRVESEWEKLWSQWMSKSGDRGPATTPTGVPIKALYTPKDLTQFDYLRDSGFPGLFPFTRGIYPTMYRGRPWTMRMVTGYGTPEDTNQRFKYMLNHGETGLNLVLDSPTIYGYDSDDSRVAGEVGQGGSPIVSMEDMEVAYKDIPIHEVTSSLITYFLGMPVFGMYVAMGEKRGLPPQELGGTTQNDPLMLFHVGNPPLPLEAAVKLSVDLLEWCARNMPRWYAVSVCGYQLREAGATAVQEAAFSIADGMVYLEEAVRRGLTIDEASRHVSFFLCSYDNLFEEIAKFRAMRKIWAKLLKDKYQAKDPRSWLFKFHAQTSGVALTAQEPENNIVRTTVQALSAILGGAQSLHTDAMDEALGLPTEKAAKIALRTQQILLLESGAADVIDPLGGSYYLEWLTERMEEEIWKLLGRVEGAGGMLNATRHNMARSEITNSAYTRIIKMEKGEIPKVAMNTLRSPDAERTDIQILRVTLDQENRQIERVKALKTRRNQEAVKRSLEDLRNAAQRKENLTPYAIKAAKSYATVGEIFSIFREAYGQMSPIPLV